jgi:hypothetical protein
MSALYQAWRYDSGSHSLLGSLTLSVFADDELIHTVAITDEEMYRLPDGFKAKRWKFGFSGNLHLKSFKVAETGKELAKV